MTAILLRMLRRQWRQGETLLLGLAVMLAVFACYLLAGIGSVLYQGLEASGARLLGADRILVGSRPAEPSWAATFDQLALTHSQQTVFGTMLYRPSTTEQDEQMLLVEVTSLDSQYPLKGALVIETESGVAELGQPATGSLWLDERLKSRLALRLGDAVEIGLAEFHVAGWIKQRPDSGVNPFAAMPSVLMAESDVAATQVIQPGSRVSYRYLLQGDSAALAQLDAQFENDLPAYFRYQGVSSEGGAFAEQFSNTETFLRLAALLVVLLSLAALAVSSQRFVDKQQKQVAIFKALGRTTPWIATLYLAFIASLVGVSSAVGLVLSQSALWGISLVLQQWIGEPLPVSSSSALFLTLSAVWSGCVIFLWQPIGALLRTSPAALLQEQMMARATMSHAAKGLLVLLVILVIQGFTRSWLLTGLLAGVMVASMLLVFVLSWGVLSFLTRVPWQSTAARLAIKALHRQVKQNQLLTSGFTLAALLVLAILFLRHDLLQQYQRQLPQNAANHFAINVQPYEVAEFKQFLEQNGFASSYTYPVIRGRLARINDQPVSERDAITERAKRSALGRELSMTYRAQLPEGNKVVEGHYLDEHGSVSVEAELAQGLGVKIGDTLTFDVAGTQVNAQISSFREVDWNNMRPNFFMITSDDVLSVFPANYLVSFNASEDNRAALNQLIRQFPTVTLIDIQQILTQFEQIITQITHAMSLVLALVTLAAGLLLLAQIRVGMDRRMRMLVTMQTLGASLSLLQRMTLLEFALLGMLSGVIAAASTEVMLAVIFTQLFNLHAEFHPLLWVASPVFTVGVIVSLGWLQCRHLLRTGALTRQRMRG